MSFKKIMTILADPPWQFTNRTGKMAPEHKRLSRYSTLSLREICDIVWHKVRKDGGPDGRGVGFYFRNTTELVLFGIRGSMRTLAPGRRQVNIIKSIKQEHSRKPDQLYEVIEQCSPGPHLELFARGTRKGWSAWGNQAEDYQIAWDTYKNTSNQPVQTSIHLPFVVEQSRVKQVVSFN